MSLDGEQLQDRARVTARALPRVQEGYPLTATLQCFTVSGRVFLIVTEDPELPIITVKSEPEVGRALAAQYERVAPGRYFSKRHWISVAPGEGITDELVADLVQDSWDLVVEGVPRAARSRRGE
ncbi:MmcQ/YjbR family DNA-binding protein [Luteococcus sediminum]